MTASSAATAGGRAFGSCASGLLRLLPPCCPLLMTVWVCGLRLGRRVLEWCLGWINIGSDGMLTGPMGTNFPGSGVCDGVEDDFLDVGMTLTVDRPMAFLSLRSGECEGVFVLGTGGT